MNGVGVIDECIRVVYRAGDHPEEDEGKDVVEWLWSGFDSSLLSTTVIYQHENNWRDQNQREYAEEEDAHLVRVDWTPAIPAELARYELIDAAFKLLSQTVGSVANRLMVLILKTHMSLFNLIL